MPTIQATPDACTSTPRRRRGGYLRRRGANRHALAIIEARRDLTGADYAVARKLAELEEFHYRHEPDVTFAAVTQADLAEWLRIPVRTIKRILERLRDVGVLIWERTGRASRFRIARPEPPAEQLQLDLGLSEGPPRPITNRPRLTVPSPTPDAAASGAPTSPNPTGCPAHPTPRRRCRGCGTSPRQLRKAAQRARQAARDAEHLAPRSNEHVPLAESSAAAEIKALLERLPKPDPRPRAWSRRPTAR